MFFADSDEYTHRDGQDLRVELQVKGAKNFNTVVVDTDESVVLRDSTLKNGVDVFKAKKGYTGSPEGSALLTIFP